MTEENQPLDSTLGELSRITNEVKHYATNSASPVGDLTAPEFKELLASKRAEVYAKQQELQLAAANARAALEKAEAEARAAMIPLQKELKKMAEGIWTVGLYLGVDEEIVPLRGGTPAPVHTPISVRQQVLAMDEESIIAAEEGGIDVNDIDAFDRWIISNPAHLQQVLPEPKGVVAILPSRQQRDYGDPWINTTINEKNLETWFLIRNGERLYRLLAKDFNVGSRLIPLKNEFTSYFVKDKWGRKVEPGSPAWLEAEEAAGAKQRHYMRVALILQGLIERTEVFTPVPEGLSLLTLDAYESGQVVTVSDDENVLTSSRQPFNKWLAERVSQLRPGMRIVGAFNSNEFREANDNESNRYARHSRLSPETAELPPSEEVLYVERGGKGKGLVCRYERTESVWDESSYTYRPAQKRASVSIDPTDKFIIPIDLVTIEEMEDYINARSERHNYLTLVPLMRAAIAVKKAELEEEAPFRRLITDTLSINHGETQEDAERIAVELVDWWKFANRHHRPLVSDDDAFVAKAMRMIVAEYTARKKLVSSEDKNRQIASEVRGLNPNVMAVLRKRDGSILALVPSVSKYEVSTPNSYYHQYRYVKGELVLTKEWSTIAPHFLAKMQTLWSNDVWESWDITRDLRNEYTDLELDAIVQKAQERSGLLAIGKKKEYLYYSNEYELLFNAYYYDGEIGQDNRSHWNSHTGVALSVVNFKVHRKGAEFMVAQNRTTSIHWTESKNAPWGKDILFTDKANVAVALSDLRPHEEERLAKERLSSTANKLAYKVNSTWDEKVTQEAREAHIADYGTDDLWKHWLRTHKLPQCPVNRDVLVRVIREYLVNNPESKGTELAVSDLFAGDTAEQMKGITVTIP